VELATHLMEPKLEKWLNEHLPELVEQIVREEIKKIIPKD
jgi:cell pole-organizing protein PopZ